jgi:hypothetical protein
MLDLSTLKTWTDGLWAVISAPDIVVPLLVLLGIAVWLGCLKEYDEKGFNRLSTGEARRLPV